MDFLIKYGADPNIKDRSGKSALDVATEKGNLGIGRKKYMKVH